MKLEGYPLPAQAVLVIMEIVSLYSNVPHEESCLIVEEILRNKTPLTYFLMELVNIILENKKV